MNIKMFILLIICLSSILVGQPKTSGIVIEQNEKQLPDITFIDKNKGDQTIADCKGFYFLGLNEKKDDFMVMKDDYNVAVFENSYGGNDSISNKKQTDAFDLNLEELLQLEVISASKIKEKLSNVPATIFVISKNDIEERGYKSIVDILSDLPGMDLSIISGQIGFNNYWRGYRSSFGQPYLVLLDGRVLNETYYNHANTIRTIALSNIEKIEVVYGPVSSVYGANAFMGVINIMTQKNLNEGLTFKSNITTTPKGDFISDIFVAMKNNDLSIKKLLQD